MLILVSHPHTSASLSDEPTAKAEARVRRSAVTEPDEAYKRPEGPVTTTADSPQTHIRIVEIICISRILSN